MSEDGVFKLAKRVRLKHDAVRGGTVLLGPEAVILLNPEGAEVLELCDGSRTEAEIIEAMQRRHPEGDVAADVRAFLERVLRRGWVERS